MQFFLDIGDDLNFTGGYFYYENDIDQQLDFYSPDGWSRYTEPADYGILGPTAYLAGGGVTVVPAWLLNGGDTSTNHRTARDQGRAGLLPNLAGAVPIPSFSHPSINEVYFRRQSMARRHLGDGGASGPRPGVRRHHIHLGHREPHQGMGRLPPRGMADDGAVRLDSGHPLRRGRQGGGGESVPLPRSPWRACQLRQ